MDKEHSPLSPHCARALSDKLYDKRKAASLEIEKSTREFIARNNINPIRKMLKVLGQDFALNPNPNSRKGGLLGISAVAIQLKSKCPEFLDDMIHPVLACLSDPDQRVRYHACESLYNVVKVARGGTLPYFNHIFDCLARLATDQEPSVRSGAEALDRLMKDIVSESPAFDLVSFITMLRERLATKNTIARQFLLSWISAMNSMPDIDMMVFLPEILHGLFEILADPALQKNCQSTLDSFLETIKKNPQSTSFLEMTAILIDHAQSPNLVVQLTAITWLDHFINLSGNTIIVHTSGILVAVLPNLQLESNNETSDKISACANKVNDNLLDLVTSDEAQSPPLDLQPVIQVLKEFLNFESTQTRMAVLKWILRLHLKRSNEMQNHMELIFSMLLDTLSDKADEVVLLDLEVLSEISKKESSDSQKDFFGKFMNSLLELFSQDKKLLERRGSFIIRQLCVLLPAEDIYRSMGQRLHEEGDYTFSQQMVQILNAILLTTTELFPLRNKLKHLESQECRELFVCLYKVWCHHPLAAFSLCLLSRNFRHCCDLIRLFAEIEITAEFLVEVDKLIQLIESPIFTFLRLELLDPQENNELIKALYGLLMLLPQSDAFMLLRTRLMCIPSNHNQMPSTTKQSGVTSNPAEGIDFEELLKYFQNVQAKKKEYIETKHRQRLREKLMITHDSGK